MRIHVKTQHIWRSSEIERVARSRAQEMHRVRCKTARDIRFTLRRFVVKGESEDKRPISSANCAEQAQESVRIHLQLDRRVPTCLSPFSCLGPHLQMSSLPGGWVAAVDPGSGRTYYANTVTGVTSWEVPAEV